jgi:hypothetical protein
MFGRLHEDPIHRALQKVGLGLDGLSQPASERLVRGVDEVSILMALGRAELAAHGGSAAQELDELNQPPPTRLVRGVDEDSIPMALERAEQALDVGSAAAHQRPGPWSLYAYESLLTAPPELCIEG